MSWVLEGWGVEQDGRPADARSHFFLFHETEWDGVNSIPFADAELFVVKGYHVYDHEESEYIRVPHTHDPSPDHEDEDDGTAA